MTTQYILQKDVAGYNGWGLQFCDQKYNVTLPATTDTTLTVPINGAMGQALNSVNKWIAIVEVRTNGSGKDSVWFSLNATAAVPAGATFALTNSDLINSGSYYGVVVKAGDVMHFLAPTANTDVLVKFYALAAT